MRFSSFVVAVLVIVATAGIVLLTAPRCFTTDSVRRIDSEMTALNQYKKEFGQYPTGDSATVCRLLAGENTKKIIFLEWRTKSISPKGEFLDPWGSPYAFYFSETDPLIRSAGKNAHFEITADKNFDDYFH